jgi:hypothetical protein
MTVVSEVDKAPELRAELEELLGLSPTRETTRDGLLAPGADWYRTALQHVTYAGLDVLEKGARIPLSEYAAFENPSESAMQLLSFLTEVSDGYRRCCSTYDATERFWLDFFRQGPAPELDQAGRSLWNVAG